MKIFVFILALLSLISISNYAQDVNFEWAKSSGGSLDDLGISIAIDGIGNIYSTGYFQDTVDFNPSEDTSYLTSNGLRDIYIQKLDPNGDFIWAKSIGGVSYDKGNSIFTDDFGNVYLTGSFIDTVDFDPGLDTFNLISNGSHEVFILKLYGNGEFVWAKSFMGTSNDAGQSLTGDTMGNIYLTGSFKGTVDFDPSSVEFNLTSKGGTDIFITKLDFNGSFIWAVSIGSYNYDPDYGEFGDYGHSITVDSSGFVYVTGSFIGTVDFDPGIDVFYKSYNGYDDIFILKLNNNGNFVWAKTMGGSFFDSGNSITTDATGNVYITGNFFNSVDFNPGEETNILSSNGAGSDVFVQKLNSDGNFIWAKSMGSTSDEYGSSVISDSFGNVFVAGGYWGTVDFDPNEGYNNLTSNGYSDIFIQKLDANGDFIWAKSFGGPLWDGVSDIKKDTLGNLFITGNFKDTVDFDTGNMEFDLTSNGGSDVFVLKLSQEPVGIEENYIALGSIAIYPNPTQGVINIELGSLKEVSIKIFSISGQMIYHKENINGPTYQLELNSAPGIYILEFNSKNTRQFVKLIKK